MTISSKKKRKRENSQALRLSLIILACIAMLAVVSLFSSCKTRERIVSHTEYVDRIKYDSIYLAKHDSVFIRQKGDTVTVETFHTLTRDKLVIRRDTVSRTDTVTSAPIVRETVKKVKVYGFFWWAGLVAIIGLTAFAAFKLASKTKVVKRIKSLLKII